MRRNDDIELFSMSFLDLISCAMAGILVLYTVASRGGPQSAPRRETPAQITLSFKDDIVGKLGFSVRLVNGPKTYLGSSTRRVGQWVVAQSPLKATLLLNEPLRKDAKLVIYVEDFDFTKDATKYAESVEVDVLLFQPTATPQVKTSRITMDKAKAFYVEQKL